MRIESDKVYVYRTPVEGSEAPFEVYRDLAYAALTRLDVDLPESGRITLKPNATVLYPPEQRIITHPGFLAGMIDALTDQGAALEQILIAEGNSGEHPEGGHTWKVSGYSDMLADKGVALEVLNGVETTSVAVEGGVVYDSYPIATAIAGSAFLFNVPLAKCHNLVCTTLSIKNLMGVLTSPVRHLCSTQEIDKPLGDDLWRITETGLSLFEDRFYHKLADLVTAVRAIGMPRLSVVDGLIGRDGTGFNEGDNYPLGWTVIGENEVHVDTVATYLMGLDPLQTPYLMVAARRGLGTNAIEDIEVVNLADGEVMNAAALNGARRPEPLMPICRTKEGYYPRYHEDGTAVPWSIDRINEQLEKDGKEALPVPSIAYAT